jgi:hypothetical protein
MGRRPGPPAQGRGGGPWRAALLLALIFPHGCGVARQARRLCELYAAQQHAMRVKPTKPATSTRPCCPRSRLSMFSARRSSRFRRAHGWRRCLPEPNGGSDAGPVLSAVWGLETEFGVNQGRFALSVRSRRALTTAAGPTSSGPRFSATAGAISSAALPTRWLRARSISRTTAGAVARPRKNRELRVLLECNKARVNAKTIAAFAERLAVSSR